MLSFPAVPATQTPSPLENGDKLTRQEFERRYQAIPHLKKAELIEGTVFMASPLRANARGIPHARIRRCTVVYESTTESFEI